VDNTPIIAGLFAFVMAVFVWWSGRRDKQDAAKALVDKEDRDRVNAIAKDERDRANAKADRDEMNASLRATQVQAAGQAAQVIADEIGTQGRRDAQTARDHQEELVTEQARAAKVITDQLAAAARDRKAADLRAAGQALELAKNTGVTADVATELAKNTDITKTVADGQQALLDQVTLVTTRVDQGDLRTAALETRLELFARSHAAAHLSEGQRITAEIEAPLAPPKET
jgi:hypothetical protein